MREKDIEQFIQKLKDHGLMYFDPLERRVRVFNYTLDRIKRDEITITVAYGYGLNEVWQNYTIKIDELNDFADKFDPPEEIVKLEKNTVSGNNGTVKPTNITIKDKIVTIKQRKITEETLIINEFNFIGYMSELSENTLGEMRIHLFDALRKLSNGNMKHEEAKAVASVSQTIINSIKVELDYKIFAKKSPAIKMLDE